VSRSGPAWRRARGAFARRLWPFVAFGRSTDARFGAAVRDGAALPGAGPACARGRGWYRRGVAWPEPGGSPVGNGGLVLPRQRWPAYRGLLGARPCSRPLSTCGKPQLAWGLEGVTACPPARGRGRSGRPKALGWPRARLWKESTDCRPGFAPVRPKPVRGPLAVGPRPFRSRCPVVGLSVRRSRCPLRPGLPRLAPGLAVVVAGGAG
jgi:hypothetical protein